MTSVSFMSRLRGWDAHIVRLVVFLMALCLVFLAFRSREFLSTATWQSMAVQFPEYGLMALGVMLTMVTGGIDLSSVGVANMTSAVSATVMLAMAPRGASDGQQLVSVLVAVLVALLLGLAAGLLNGFLVAVVRIPAILVTLGTLELFTGVAIVISNGRPISGLPPAYSSILGGKLLGIPMPLVVFLVVALLIGFVLHLTSFGAKLYLLGSNATAAKFSGLDSVWLLVRTYALSGLCAGAASLVMLANYNSAKADYGVNYTLLTVLIVVLGGVNPNGGSGRLIGVLLAIAILQILSSGLNAFPQINNFYRPLLFGAVLLIVVSTTDLGKRLRFTRKEPA
ncbi:ABC transporter permease [Arachnia propionica]|uniref:ABC transporter permease n=1 Tax=Arachnia propionica TaxID=1750 RepID=A0A3P1WWA5_9ACTN|nr:ABC transporter permease [Arachnia propionica]RRD50934.1 ABC transporter permease [Arachnia propionica]